MTKLSLPLSCALVLWASAPCAAQINLGPSDDVESALNALSPGDEVILADGMYTLSGRFSFTAVGEAGNEIVIRAADGATPHFRRPDASQNIWDIDVQYVVIRGLTFSGGSAGIRVEAASNLTIEDCEIFDTDDVALRMNDARGGQTYESVRILRNNIHDTGGTGEGMYLGCNNDGCRLANALIAGNYVHETNAADVSQGDGIELKLGSYGCVIRDNVIHDTRYPCILGYGTNGNGAANLVEGNVMWGCGDHAIQWAADATIENNIILGAVGNGIASQMHQGATPSNLRIVHNTVLAPNNDALSVRGATGAVLVANNALYAMSGRAFFVNGDSSMITSLGNVGVGAQQGISGGFMAGDVGADFVGASFSGGLPNDVFPTSGGALRGAGDVGEVIADDFNGTDRMGVADVGAYAFGDGSNPGWMLDTDFKPAGATPPPRTDAGVPMSDGGIVPPRGDGGPPPVGSDAGRVIPADAGVIDPGGDGCGCRVVGRSRAPMAFWLFAALLGASVWRRRPSHAAKAQLLPRHRPERCAGQGRQLLRSASYRAPRPRSGCRAEDDRHVASPAVPDRPCGTTASDSLTRETGAYAAASGRKRQRCSASENPANEKDREMNFLRFVALAIAVSLCGCDEPADASGTDAAGASDAALDSGTDSSVLDSGDVLDAGESCHPDCVDPPTDLSAVALSGYQVQLSWSASDDARRVGFRVLLEDASVVTTAATNYLHGGRAPATTYTYRVASVDASGNLSPPSAPATVTTPSDGAATELALAAAALEPGEWVELETMGLDDGAIFATDGGGGMIEYMTEAMWDPIGRRAFIMGTARGSCTPICYGPTNVKWVQWSELTNGWTRLPFTAFYPGAHTYEHAALNPRTGDYYMRVAESSSVYHLPVGGSAWMPLPNLPIGASIANSLQYFPDMEALVFIAGRSTGDTAIFRLNDGASSWERLAESADLPMGNYHDFGEYSAVHNVMFFGGGTIYTVGNQRNFYELDADGNTRRLADLPFAVGVNGAITVAEPNTGNLLVFSRGAPETFAEYIYTTDSWVTHEMPDDFSVRDSYGSIPTVAAPIPEYGVIIFFKNAGTGSRVMLYRHRSE